MSILKNLAPKIRLTSGRPQRIMSEPRKLLIDRYLSPKGKRLLNEGKISKEIAWKKYGKNRYTINLNSKPIKLIYHEK